MAAKKQNGGFDLRQLSLLVYVGLCVGLVILALVVAFADADLPLGQPPAATEVQATATPNPLVLTLQADEYEPAESDAASTSQP
jgi:hypothetical protein